MKPFDYNKYLKNNPLLKEERGALQQEISALLSKFRQPSNDTYEVELYYFDYPSIPNIAMKHASQVFHATTKACGGMAKRIGGDETDQIFMVKGCPMDNLQKAWEYLGDYDSWSRPDNESPALWSARGTAGSWRIRLNQKK